MSDIRQPMSQKEMIRFAFGNRELTPRENSIITDWYDKLVDTNTSLQSALDEAEKDSEKGREYLRLMGTTECGCNRVATMYAVAAYVKAHNANAGQQECKIDPWSSRVCERGIRCCTVRHNAGQPKEKE